MCHATLKRTVRAASQTRATHTTCSRVLISAANQTDRMATWPRYIPLRV